MGACVTRGCITAGTACLSCGLAADALLPAIECVKVQKQQAQPTRVYTLNASADGPGMSAAGGLEHMQRACSAQHKAAMPDHAQMPKLQQACNAPSESISTSWGSTFIPAAAAAASRSLMAGETAAGDCSYCSCYAFDSDRRAVDLYSF